MMFILNLGGLLHWVERKQSAIMQDASAPTAPRFRFRALGCSPARRRDQDADEGRLPAGARRPLPFQLAPFVSVFFGLVAFASIPFGDTLRVR